MSDTLASVGLPRLDVDQANLQHVRHAKAFRLGDGGSA